MSSDHLAVIREQRRTFLAYAALSGFVGCFTLLITLLLFNVKVGEGWLTLVLTNMITCLATVLVMVYSYDFGSSSGSDAKSNTIADIAIKKGA